MKKSTLLPALIAASFAATTEPYEHKRKIRITGFKYAVIPKGCQVYEEDGVRIYALNEASAKRKFEKIRKVKENK